jgi:hypothetical protein
MKRRLVLVLALAAFAWMVVADKLQSARLPAADWARPRKIVRDDITAYYPRGWEAAVDGNRIVIRSRTTTVWLSDYGHRHADEWPARPRHFVLADADRHFQTCGFDFEGWNLTFTDHGQVVQAVVRVAPGASRSDASMMLDRLSVAG